MSSWFDRNSDLPVEVERTGRVVAHPRTCGRCHGAGCPEVRLITPTEPCFKLDVPCPSCGNHVLLGYYFVNERAEHMHTYYVCTFWRSGAPARCGWEGWSVPGADGS